MLDEVGNRLSGLSLSGGGEFKGRGVPSRKGESKRRGSPKGGGRGWNSSTYISSHLHEIAKLIFELYN